jgi:hypothetical protein
MLSSITVSVVMLGVITPECRYSECLSSEQNIKSV